MEQNESENDEGSIVDRNMVLIVGFWKFEASRSN